MSPPPRRAILVTIALAAVTGAVAAGVAAALLPFPSSVEEFGDEPTEGPPRVGPDGGPGAVALPAPPVVDPLVPEGPVPPGALGTSERFESDDERVRTEAARELLRRGPAALALARALSPSRPEGARLAEGVALALDRMRLDRKLARYGMLTRDMQLELRLAAMRTVLDDGDLLEERREFWTARVKMDHTRLDRGFIDAAQLSLAELELVRVRVELGEAPRGEFEDALRERTAVIDAWAARRVADRRIRPADREALRAQVEGLKRF